MEEEIKADSMKEQSGLPGGNKMRNKTASEIMAELGMEDPDAPPKRRDFPTSLLGAMTL